MPRCPLVLSLLEAGPCRAYEVARRLGDDHAAALATLDRLQRAGLVRRRGGLADYQLTARGRRELRLQRLLWTRIVAAGSR
jgi:DNA-binding PadR family transcriptional regulator